MVKYLIIGIIIGFVYRGVIELFNKYYRRYKQMERKLKMYENIGQDK